MLPCISLGKEKARITADNLWLFGRAVNVKPSPVPPCTLALDSNRLQRQKSRGGGILDERRVDICCLQEVRWKGDVAKILRIELATYKLFWKGGEKGEAGVGMMV